jgi:hypothetical protein
MSKHPPLIYLCGPIHGLTFDTGNAWRTEATSLLQPEFGVLNPLRNKAFEGTDYSKYTDHELITRDLRDIRVSRAVLRFTPSASHGSDMETFYAAHVCNIPVVTFGPGQGDRTKLSLWLRHHTVNNFEYLEDAVDYLKGMWTYPDDGLIDAKYDVRTYLRREPLLKMA